MKTSESYDNWPYIVAKWDGWRIIESRCDIQWIVQVARHRRGRCEWEGKSYLRTREGLKRCSPTATPAVVAILDALPERYPDGHRGKNAAREGAFVVAA